jgi:hypothetical protein
MGRVAIRGDLSGALSAIVVVALILATTTLMLVTLSAARALEQGAVTSQVGGCQSVAPASPGYPSN